MTAILKSPVVVLTVITLIILSVPECSWMILLNLQVNGVAFSSCSKTRVCN
jgi:hypothetical protein